MGRTQSTAPVSPRHIRCASVSSLKRTVSLLRRLVVRGRGAGQGEGSTGTLEPVVPFCMARVVPVTQIHMGSERTSSSAHTPDQAQYQAGSGQGFPRSRRSPAGDTRRGTQRQNKATVVFSVMLSIKGRRPHPSPRTRGCGLGWHEGLRGWDLRGVRVREMQTRGRYWRHSSLDGAPWWALPRSRGRGGSGGVGPLSARPR